MPCIVLHYSALLQGHHALIAAGGCIQPEFDWTYVMSCLPGPQLIARILWLPACVFLHEVFNCGVLGNGNSSKVAAAPRCRPRGRLHAITQSAAAMLPGCPG